MADLVLQIRAEDLASNVLQAVSQQLHNVESSAQEASHSGSMLSNAFSFATGGLIGKGIEAVAGAVGDLKEGLIGGNAQFETYGVQFQTLIRNSQDFKDKYSNITDPLELQAKAAEEAKKRMQDLATFGQVTPFELPQVVEADRVLQGFGLHSQEAAKKFGFSGEEIRTIAGDVASGTGTQFNEMALLLGKFSTGATGEAISRMQELGITSRDELTKMGLKFSSAGQLLSPLPESMNTVLKLMKQKYGGLMDAQSATFDGMVSNMQDWIAGTLRTLGQPLFEGLKGQLQGLLAFLNSDAVQGGITFLAETIATVLGGAFNLLGSIIPTVQGLFSQFSGSLTPVLDIVTLVGNAFNVLADIFSGDIGVALDDLHEGFFTLVPPEMMPLLDQIVISVGNVLGVFRDFGMLITTGFNLNGLEGALTYFLLWGETLQFHLGELAIAFSDWVIVALPPLLVNLGNLLGQVLLWATDAIGSISLQLAQWGLAFVEWVMPMSSQLLGLLTQVGTIVLQWVADYAPPLLQQLVGWGLQFLSWLLPIIPPLMAQASQLLNQVLDWLTTAIPPILGQLAEWGHSFLVWLLPQIPPLLEQLGSLISAMLENMAGNLANILDHLGQWGRAFVEWVAPRIPPLLAELGNLLGATLNWLIGTALPGITGKLEQWGESIVAWVAPRIPPLLEALGSLLVALGGWLLSTALPAIVAKLAEWGKAFGEWVVTTAIPKLMEGLGSLWSSLSSWLGQKASEVGSEAAKIGQNLVNSLVNAILGGLGSIKDAAAQLATSAYESAKSALHINSPSLLFQELGAGTVEGMVKGINDTKDDAVIAAKNMVDQIIAPVGTFPESLRKDRLTIDDIIAPEVFEGYPDVYNQIKQYKFDYDEVHALINKDRVTINDFIAAEVFEAYPDLYQTLNSFTIDAKDLLGRFKNTSKLTTDDFLALPDIPKAYDAVAKKQTEFANLTKKNMGVIGDNKLTDDTLIDQEAIGTGYAGVLKKQDDYEKASLISLGKYGGLVIDNMGKIGVAAGTAYGDGLSITQPEIAAVYNDVAPLTLMPEATATTQGQTIGIAVGTGYAGGLGSKRNDINVAVDTLDPQTHISTDTMYTSGKVLGNSAGGGYIEGVGLKRNDINTTVNDNFNPVSLVSSDTLKQWGQDTGSWIVGGIVVGIDINSYKIKDSLKNSLILPDFTLDFPNTASPSQGFRLSNTYTVGGSGSSVSQGATSLDNVTINVYHTGNISDDVDMRDLAIKIAEQLQELNK